MEPGVPPPSPPLATWRSSTVPWARSVVGGEPPLLTLSPLQPGSQLGGWGPDERPSPSRSPFPYSCCFPCSSSPNILLLVTPPYSVSARRGQLLALRHSLTSPSWLARGEFNSSGMEVPPLPPDLSSGPTLLRSFIKLFSFVKMGVEFNFQFTGQP